MGEKTDLDRAIEVVEGHHKTMRIGRAAAIDKRVEYDCQTGMIVLTNVLADLHALKEKDHE